MIHIKYFASIRELIGVDQQSWPHEAGLTIGHLRSALAASSALHAQALGAHQPVRAAVNLQLVSDVALVPEHAEVAFFPPMTGG